MSNKVPQIRFNGYSDAWEERKLGELANIVRGASPRPIQDPKWFDKDSDIGWLRISDVTEQDGRIRHLEQRISKLGQEKTRVLMEPHLLLSIAATVGKPLVNYVKTGVHDGFLIFLNPVFDREFMFQWLDMFRPKWKKYGQPGSQVNLNSELVRNQEIDLPRIEEQQQIGSFFKQLDDIIALHQRKLTKLKKLKQGYLQKLFPKNGSKFPQLRFAGFADAWEQRKLSEISTMNARIGWQNLRTSEFLDSGDYMLITGTDFKDGKINYSSIHYVEKERYDQDKKIQIKNESILITKDGTLGKVAYVKGLTMPATLNAGVFNVRVRESNLVDSQYLFHYLKAPFLLKYASAQSTGGTIKHLNQNVLVDFPVPLPIKQEQQKIGTFFQQLDHLIALHQRKLDLLKEQKKGYLQKMFV